MVLCQFLKEGKRTAFNLWSGFYYLSIFFNVNGTPFPHSQKHLFISICKKDIKSKYGTARNTRSIGHPKNKYALDVHACDTIFAVNKSH